MLQGFKKTRHKAAKPTPKLEVLLDNFAKLQQMAQAMRPRSSLGMSEHSPEMANCVSVILKLMEDPELLSNAIQTNRELILGVAMLAASVKSAHILRHILKMVPLDIITNGNSLNLIAMAYPDNASLYCVLDCLTPATLKDMITKLSDNEKISLLNKIPELISMGNVTVIQTLATHQAFLDSLVRIYAHDTLSFADGFGLLFASAEINNPTLLRLMVGSPGALDAFTFHLRHNPFLRPQMLKALLLCPHGLDEENLIKILHRFKLLGNIETELQETLEKLKNPSDELVSTVHLSRWFILAQFWHNPNINQQTKAAVENYLQSRFNIDLQTSLAKLSLSPMDYLILSDNYEEIRKELSKDPTKAKCVMTHLPLIHMAIGSPTCKAEHLDVLLALGMSINAKRIAGNTPLHVAIHTGRKDWFRILLSKGADINLTSDIINDTHNFLMQVAKEVMPNLDNLSAQEKVEFEQFKKQLDQATAGAKIGGDTPLHALLNSELPLDAEMLQTLLMLKPRLDIANANGLTARQCMQNTRSPNFPMIQHIWTKLKEDSLRFIAASQVLTSKLNQGIDSRTSTALLPVDIHRKILSYCFPYQQSEKLKVLIKPIISQQPMAIDSSIKERKIIKTSPITRGKRGRKR